MLEKGTSGLMSGEGKRAAASRPRTALFLDSTNRYEYWNDDKSGLSVRSEKCPGANGHFEADDLLSSKSF
jgi:hypothetical protein